jgi:hypothetical protein
MKKKNREGHLWKMPFIQFYRCKFLLTGYRVCGIWYMVYGTWDMGHGTWDMDKAIGTGRTGTNEENLKSGDMLYD